MHPGGVSTKSRLGRLTDASPYADAPRPALTARHYSVCVSEEIEREKEIERKSKGK